MSTEYSDQQLQAYLDDALSAELMSAIERDLRGQSKLQERLVSLVGLRDSGVHGLGEIWRRHRLTCPSREQLGTYLLGALEESLEVYVTFHLEQVSCRLCLANVADLKAQQTEQLATSQTRRRRYFQSSAGYLGKKNG